MSFILDNASASWDTYLHLLVIRCMYCMCALLQNHARGPIAWRLGDEIHVRGRALFCWPQLEINHIPRSPWRTRQRVNHKLQILCSWSTSCNKTARLVHQKPAVLQCLCWLTCRPKGAYGVPVQYERSFRWKLGQFRYLCQVSCLYSNYHAIVVRYLLRDHWIVWL